MRILQINQTYKLGSTGKIMFDLNNVIMNSGNQGYMLCAYSKEFRENLYVMDKGKFPLNSKINILFMRLSGLNGYRKMIETYKAIKWIDEIKPDIIHLHNIHGDWINLGLLFKYIKRNRLKVVWTLHDCWSFTGRCSHFELCGCDRWKKECFDCNNKKVYPVTYFYDFSKKMFNDKKKWYASIPMTIVTPSDWLGTYVKQSFLGHNNIVTIHNGIDINLFKKSDVNLREKYGNKKIVLGVASSWSKTKGFDDFIILDKMINHDEYHIIMVGLNSSQLKIIPNTITGIGRTNSPKELIDLYSNAYVFVNPTYQDNYPTTNLEAQSCGVPVITYNTGGSSESVFDKDFVVEQGNVNELLDAIKSINERFASNYRKIAEDNFDTNKSFNKYINLYSSVIND